MDYRKLCVELFGTDDEATLRKIAAEYRKKNTRNAGRKRKIADEDIHKMRAMRNAGTSMQELARTFGLSRQTVERYLNTAAGDGCTMRITYMFRRQPCTVIDVDFLDQKVVIQNKTDDILHRAFGVLEHPTWNSNTIACPFIHSHCRLSWRSCSAAISKNPIFLGFGMNCSRCRTLTAICLRRAHTI